MTSAAPWQPTESPRLAHTTAWAVAGQVSGSALQFFTAVLFARLLGPEALGDFAWAATTFTAFALLSDLCIQSAVIRAPELTEVIFSRYLTLSFVLGGVAAGAMLIWAVVPVAYGSGGSAVKAMLLILVPTLILSSLQQAPRGALVRAGRTRAIAVVELTALAGSIAISLPLAMERHDSKALALQLACATGFRTAGYLVTLEMRPRGATPYSIAKLWSFSRGLYGFNFLSFMGRNADNFIVGAILGSYTLGLYSRAFSLLSLPAAQLQLAIGGVLLRFFSLARQDSARVQQRVQVSAMLLSSAVFPIAIGCAVAADELVQTLFGPNWADMVVFVRAFAIVGACQLVVAPVGIALQAVGRTTPLVLIGILGLVPLGGVAVGAALGMPALLAGLYAVLAGPIYGLSQMLVLNRVTGISLMSRRVGCVQMAACFVCLAVAIVTVSLCARAGLPGVVTLAITLAFSVTSYAAILAALARDLLISAVVAIRYARS